MFTVGVPAAAFLDVDAGILSLCRASHACRHPTGNFGLLAKFLSVASGTEPSGYFGSTVSVALRLLGWYAESLIFP